MQEKTQARQAVQEQYLLSKQVAERFGTTTTSLRRWVADGKFPKPLKITARTSRWRLSDIEAWEAAKS